MFIDVVFAQCFQGLSQKGSCVGLTGQVFVAGVFEFELDVADGVISVWAVADILPDSPPVLGMFLFLIL